MSDFAHEPTRNLQIRQDEGYTGNAAFLALPPSILQEMTSQTKESTGPSYCLNSGHEFLFLPRSL